MRLAKIARFAGFALLVCTGIYRAWKISRSQQDSYADIPSYVSATSSVEVGTSASSLTAVFTEAPKAQADDQNVPGEIPTRIIIPYIGVDAPIHPLGITSTGNLDVPPDLSSVGWYRYGPIPGAGGNAVLDGHVDNGAAMRGVFSNLKYLRKGDSIYITDANDSRSRFVVVDSTIYSAGDFPSEQIFDVAGDPELKIITCNGTFIQSKKTYDKRLVVSAVPVP